jgi:hypothetical protein
VRLCEYLDGILFSCKACTRWYLHEILFILFGLALAFFRFFSFFDDHDHGWDGDGIDISARSR